MLRRISAIVVLVICASVLLSANQSDSDFRTSYYKAFASDDTLRINKEIKAIQEMKLPGKEAFTGGLLMKKSGLIPLAGKLNCFNLGRKKLEHAIQMDPGNAEFRFLRLMIQENCPPVLRYNGQIETDAGIISREFPSFPPELKIIVRDYSKQSRYLKVSNF